MRYTALQTHFKTRGFQKTWIALLIICTTIGVYFFTMGRPLPNVLEDYGKNEYYDRFLGFNNETGSENGDFIVPNIIHFIVFQNPQISFVHFVCVLAAMKNQKPEKIYFHTNLSRFKGIYWPRLLNIKQFKDILIIRHIEIPTEIFNQRIRSDMQIFHGGDIARIRILIEFGGIYLDNDSYIVKSLDYYRKFEMAIGWDEGEFLGTQIIVANKDARFLKLWLKSYDGAYYTDRWYFNAGEWPTKSILYKRPDLVHRVKLLFGNKVNFIFKLFQEYWSGWKDNYAFHLLARKNHQYMLHNISEDATYPVDFNEYNLQKYPITFREMANDALAYEKVLKSI